MDILKELWAVQEDGQMDLYKRIDPIWVQPKGKGCSFIIEHVFPLTDVPNVIPNYI